MSQTIQLTIDGKPVDARPGQTILEAADGAGVYIPRLCHMQGLTPHGSCRVCTVLVNGRPQAACVQPVAPGMVIENDSEKITHLRRNIVEMLFVEGNHFCMFCEKSGRCELQAVAYRLKIMAPKYPFQYPVRKVDATHPDVWIDHNRCILCGRCVRASRDLDGKNLFEFVDRGPHKKLAVNTAARLDEAGLEAADQAVDACPVGALMRKHVGYDVPMGQRRWDNEPIGSDIERQAAPAGK